MSAILLRCFECLVVFYSSTAVFRGPLTPQSNAIRVFIEELRRDDRSIVVFNHLAKVGLDYNAEKKSSPKVLIVLTYVLLCCLYKLGNSILILLPDAGFTSPYYFLSFPESLAPLPWHSLSLPKLLLFKSWDFTTSQRTH